MQWPWWSPTDRQTASRLAEQDREEYVRLGGYSSVVGAQSGRFCCDKLRGGSSRALKL